MDCLWSDCLRLLGWSVDVVSSSHPAWQSSHQRCAASVKYLLPQVFGEERRAALPNVTRLAQTVLWHPKAVGVMRARLQPPAAAHAYAKGAANPWGPGPSPAQPLDWTFAAHLPWTGGASHD